MKLKQEKFTLVELLVVIVIIAICALVLMPFFSKPTKHIHRPSCKANLNSLGQSLMMYKMDYGQFPDAENHNDLVDCASSTMLEAPPGVFHCPQEGNEKAGSAEGPRGVVPDINTSDYAYIGGIEPDAYAPSSAIIADWDGNHRSDKWRGTLLRADLSTTKRFKAGDNTDFNHEALLRRGSGNNETSYDGKPYH